MLDLLAGCALILAIAVAATWIVSLFFAATVAGEKGYIGFAWAWVAGFERNRWPNSVEYACGPTTE